MGKGERGKREGGNGGMGERGNENDRIEQQCIAVSSAFSLSPFPLLTCALHCSFLVFSVSAVPLMLEEPGHNGVSFTVNDRFDLVEGIGAKCDK